MDQKLTNKAEGRIYTIDILRVIGLFCVILAHVFPPYYLSVIRTFDVTLMVFVMCWSFLIANKKESYSCYIIKRFKRLVVSCWLFLITYYCAFALFSIVFGVQFTYTLKDIIITVFTFENFGGTWVIRVYFIIALVLPLAKYLSTKVKNRYQEFVFWFLLGIIYMIYYILFVILNKGDGEIFRFVTIILGMETFGWIICAFAFSKIICNNKKIIYYFFISFVIFFICGIYYNWSNIEIYKYPPRLYYIFYGLMVSLLMVLIFNNKVRERKISDAICERFKSIPWLSKNSLWIYYWHLLYLSLFRFILVKVSVLNKWFILYAIVLIFSIATTLVINYVKMALKVKFKYE